VELDCFELDYKSVREVGVDYRNHRPSGLTGSRMRWPPKRFGAPVVVIDFGTAVTFDVVDRKGNYIAASSRRTGALTDYLHEKTAAPAPDNNSRRERGGGKEHRRSDAIGAVHGIAPDRELLTQLKRKLKARRLPVVATGGYAELIAARLPEITAVEPLLTLEGLRLAWRSDCWVDFVLLNWNSQGHFQAIFW